MQSQSLEVTVRNYSLWPSSWTTAASAALPPTFWSLDVSNPVLLQTGQRFLWLSQVLMQSKWNLCAQECSFPISSPLQNSSYKRCNRKINTTLRCEHAHKFHTEGVMGTINENKNDWPDKWSIFLYFLLNHLHQQPRKFDAPCIELSFQDSGPRIAMFQIVQGALSASINTF